MRAAGLSMIAPLACTYACGGTAVVDDIESDGGGGAGAGGSDAGGAPTTTTTDTVTTGVTNTSGVTTGVTTGGGGQPVQMTCFPKGDEAVPCPTLEGAPLEYGYCTYEDFEYIEQWISGPHLADGACCYEVVANGPCGVGRPLRIDGRAVTAVARRGACDWTAPLSPRADLDELDDAQRMALRDGWLHDALYEHASAASFARFALELMALGAPPDLVRQAHAAAIDEVDHAGRCFALASRYAGEPLGPGAVSLDGLVVRRDLATLARETVLEGCVGETIASAIAEAQREAATDEAVREALTVIAADEARHAELAWATVAWALRTGGDEVRRAVGAAFAEAADHLPGVHTATGLGRHGRLDEDTARRVVADVLHQVVQPCAAALLAARQTPATRDAQAFG